MYENLYTYNPMGRHGYVDILKQYLKTSERKVQSLVTYQTYKRTLTPSILQKLQQNIQGIIITKP